MGQKPNKQATPEKTTASNSNKRPTSPAKTRAVERRAKEKAAVAAKIEALALAKADIALWDISTVASKANQLEHLDGELFRSHQINGAKLVRMNSNELMQLGLSSTEAHTLHFDLVSLPIDSTNSETNRNDDAPDVSTRTSSMGQKTSAANLAPPPPPRPPPRQVLNEKDRERKQRRTEHEKRMNEALKGEHQKAEDVDIAVALHEKEERERLQVLDSKQKEDQRLLTENEFLKAELIEMKKQRKEDQLKQAAAPVIDEQSLAEKIRAMLMSDMEAQSKSMLEQHTEELRMSLLSKVKFEAVQALETQNLDNANAEHLKNSPKNNIKKKSGKRRSNKSRNGRKKNANKKKSTKNKKTASRNNNNNKDDYYEDDEDYYEDGNSYNNDYYEEDDGQSDISSGRGNRADQPFKQQQQQPKNHKRMQRKTKTKPDRTSSTHPPGVPSPLEGLASFGNKRRNTKVKGRNTRMLAPLPMEDEDNNDNNDTNDTNDNSLDDIREDRPVSEEEEELPLPSLDEMDESTAKLLRQSYDLISGGNDNTTNAKAGDGYLNELHKMGGNWRKGEKEEDNSENSNVAGTKEDVEELHVENGNLGNNVNKKKKLKKRKKKIKKIKTTTTNTTSNSKEEDVHKQQTKLNEPIENPEDLEHTMSSTTSSIQSAPTLPISSSSSNTNATHRATAIHGYRLDGTIEPKVAAQEEGQKAQVPDEFLPGPILRNEPTVKLGKQEWENEVARNILVLYKANMDAIRKTESEKLQAQNLELQDDPASTPNGTPNSSPKRRKSKGKGSKLPPIGSKKSKGGRTENPTDQPSRMMKVGVHQGPGKAIKQNSPHQIWYAGSGNVRAVWDGLVVADEEEAEKAMRKLTSDFKLTGELETLEKQGKYFKYIALVEAILTARARIYERTENHWRLWRQLAVTANVFGLKLIDEKRFSQAMQMLKNATRLMEMETQGGGGEDDKNSGSQTTLSPEHRLELKAFIQDTFSYYYYKRSKSAAALQYAQKAMRIHVRLRAWEHVAKCHLHIGAILSRLRRHDEAIRAMGQVLMMVEDGRLESGGASAQKICLVAVTYHNIAVEQLLLSRVHEACVSSQNARRLARLSLSYSNRWLKNFEATHRMALAALSTQREVRTKIQSKEQAQLFQDLTKTMYT